ncbi:MAG: DUF4147 domain-containing protein [Ignavibacteria bacterium]|jgi:glycerate-2-kinase|nr:DUF4147 domain-containing protein [Ignavibacteria bacterium]MDH7527719.1 DUF4147 domain-containing protein [Ignavibacteria bacterium]NPV10957.1 DUF4147 domain-containing protein [Ignavibacteria bacterium]
MDELFRDFNIIIKEALRSISPAELFKEKIFIDTNQIICQNNSFQLDQFANIYVIGFGKASSAMASEIEKYLSEKITDGIVITKYGFKTPTQKIKVFEAGHPLPDENTLIFSNEIMNLLTRTGSNDLVICLISGGGSSLFEVPLDGIDLQTLRLFNEFLIKQKIPIHKINFFRKAISKVKGGKLLKFIYPSTCISFIISDVIGNDISVISSGPTCLDEMESFIEDDDVPKVKKYFSKEDALHQLERLIKFKKFSNELIEYHNNKVFNFIISSNRTAVDKAIEEAVKLGYEIHSFKYDVSKSVEKMKEDFINEFLNLKRSNEKIKKAIVYGGETFLEVKGTGKGGRNSHLILLILNELLKSKVEINFKFLISSFATDGNDGNTDAAGAYINNQIIEEVKNSKYSPESYLQDFDSYNFFDAFNCLIKTGPTFNNVADFFICLTSFE